MTLTENYLDKLYTSYEPEIRGDNKPIEDVDRRPNYIGMCINMLETPQEKIGCLRKVREMTVMNPFYQHRIDRFIDAITDTYEPTDKPGFVEYIRGEKDSALVEAETISEIDPLIVGGISVVGAIGATQLMKRRACKKKYPNEPQRQKLCIKMTPMGAPPSDIKSQGELDKPKKESVDLYLHHLNDQASAGPPAKEIQLKSSGAEQDDEEPPTDERTKKFEKDEAKVDLEEVIGSIAAGAGKLVAAHPGVAAGAAAVGGAYLLGKKLKNDLKKDSRQGCYDKHEGYPDRIKRCLQGRR